jgi:hypothetical protein
MAMIGTSVAVVTQGVSETVVQKNYSSATGSSVTTSSSPVDSSSLSSEAFSAARM